MLDLLSPGEANVPGKILFFGGYSVLEPGHAALSLAVVDNTGRGVSAQAENHGSDTLVSKQFEINQEVNSPELIAKNVAMAAFYITKLYLGTKGHSNKHRVTLTNSPVFGIEHKSGLGSSAAAPVSVVKSIFSAEGIDSFAHAETVNKLAQYSSAAFSGKTGSGFDVATCSAGCSIIYNRFHADSIVLPSSYGDRSDATSKLLDSIEKPWPGLLMRPFMFPADYGILFFNIEGGKTSTTSNVRLVAAWKSKHPTEYKELMNKQNDHEAEAIDKLQDGEPEGLRLSTHSAREIHRRLQNEVAKSSEGLDPIEPEPLTRLIDFAESIEGIIAGRCPGAGGWDGVAFIMDNKRFDHKRIGDIVSKGKEYALKLTHIPLRLL